MSWWMIFVSQTASNMALLPLIWLLWRHLRGRKMDVAWWWLAGAFAVSLVADTVANWADPWVIGAVYPVSQTAIIGAVFLTRYDAMKLVIVLVIVGTGDAFYRGVEGPDILLRTVAWLSVVGIIYPLRQLGQLRISLLVAFGIGWICWMGYALWPGWWSWSTYQSFRFAGILLFMLAISSPSPRLKLTA